MVAIYIHWPFCKSKCPYCDFNSHVRDEILQDEWIEAYLKEISYYKDYLKNNKITSIFFGGGTPSLMPPILVEKIIDLLSINASLATNIEITLEGNPTSIEAGKLKNFKQSGINRISLGIQSFDNDNLKFLGREHSANEAQNAIEVAAKLYGKYSFDLIYALPNQTKEQWQDELDLALKLANGHLSLYQLTIEKGTKFYSDYTQGKFKMPSNDLAADFYELTNNIMSNNGYIDYEVSNYAKSGHECKHNFNYWQYGEYLGIGAGAHGRISLNNSLYETMNLHLPENWLKSVNENNHGLQHKRKLSHQEIVEETIMMGLRLKEGILKESFKRTTQKDFDSVIETYELQYLIEQGFVINNHEKINLTNKGRLVLNSVINKIIDLI